MRILQTQDRKWFLDKRRIVSATTDLCDVVFCEEQLSYSTMRNYFVVLDTYEEAVSKFFGCYVATIRFYENYMKPTRYVWVNKDADTPLFVEKFGKNKYYLGSLGKQEYKQVKKDINELNGRCLVIQRDWYIAFRDKLIMERY